MNKGDVRIVRLDGMRVARVLGHGESPERQAWGRLREWVEARGLGAGHGEPPRDFGFNNPDPHPGSPSYGYELWLEVGPEEEAGGGADIVTFPGGLYAVARCRGVEGIGAAWQELANWCEQSSWTVAHHQWLEEHLGPIRRSSSDQELLLDLHLPIAEA